MKIRALFLFVVYVCLYVKANPPAGEWQVITPLGAGVASGGAYFPLEDAFDGTPSWNGAQAVMTGGSGVEVAPGYSSRYGYIDFGADFDQIHIMETWTKYRSYSGGSHPGYVEMWWDDDIDSTNDNGIIETRLNFNNGQAIDHLTTEAWFRDKRVNELGGVIPQKRYLILKSSSTYAGRALEFAIAGYLYDGLVPPEYADAIFLDIDQSVVEENGAWHQVVGTLSVRGGVSGESYTLTLDTTDGDNQAFELIGNTLWTTRSFDYEAQAGFTLLVDVVDSFGNSHPVELEISIADRTGDFDTNGPATAAVAASYPEINVGDYVIWNATQNSGPDIYYGNGSFSLAPPQKILIKGGVYQKISLDLSGVVGTDANNRVPITNFLGQVYTREFVLTDGVFWRLTGAYDSALGLGNADFPGCHTSEGTEDFGFSHGKYGIWVSNEWANEYESMVYVGGTAQGWEIDHLEISDGGFAGMLLKKDSGSVDMDNVYLHHLYIHDTGSEGIYLGSTQSDPQHQFNDLLIEKIVVLRTGTEALQAGQLGSNCLIQNSIFWGAMDWLSPFQRYQDNTVQVATRQGGTTFKSNILLGGGEKFYNVSNIPKSGIVPNGDPIVFENNVNWACRGIAGAYQFKQTDGVTNWIWRNTFWGGFQYEYDRVYTSSADTLGCVLVATSTVNVDVRDSIYDLSRERVVQNWASATATITQNNNQNKRVVAPRFLNLVGENVTQDYLRWNRWTATIGEDAGFPSNPTHKGDPVTFSPGDIVQYPAAGRTRFYKCLIENSEQEPPLQGNAFWELLTWTDQGRVQLVPPDDVRLAEGSLYHQLGIGVRGKGLEDVDGDELPDDWEHRNGLNPNSATGIDGATGNPDADAKNNLEEFKAFTNPQVYTHPTLKVTKEACELGLKFQAPLGRSWRLESAESLSDLHPMEEWQEGIGQVVDLELVSVPDTSFYRFQISDESELDLLP